MSNEFGQQLHDYNNQIVKYILNLKQQWSEITEIITKQKEEKDKIDREIERLTYKASLIKKSLLQRMKTQAEYEKTITQLEANYAKIVDHSGALLQNAQTEYSQLEQTMDKRINTEESPAKKQAETGAKGANNEVSYDLPEKLAVEQKAGYNEGYKKEGMIKICDYVQGYAVHKA